MTAYYNEIDPYAAQWLRNLIKAGHIAAGDVDERSIVDVRADDLRGYAQCHFFAGIGGWSIALRIAGWPDDRPVWTGSCPCQPFSAAGAGKAANDERHLWPAWFSLIQESRPATVFGEQVEAAVGWGWLDAVFSDLEAEGYACGTTVLPACGIGAHHIRQRLWFVADADGRDTGSEGLQRSRQHRQRAKDGGSGELAVSDGSAGEWGAGGVLGAETTLGRPRCPDGRIPDRFANGREAGDVADASGGGQREFGDAAQPRSCGHVDGSERTSVLADTERDGGRADEPQRQSQGRTLNGRPDPWCCEWLPCTDGKARPIRPGSFPLAHGVQRRTSKLRAYGNAIVPQVAAEFIRASQ